MTAYTHCMGFLGLRWQTDRSVPKFPGRPMMGCRLGRGTFQLSSFTYSFGLGLRLIESRMADLDTLTADVSAGIIRGRSDQDCHIVLRLVTKGETGRSS